MAKVIQQVGYVSAQKKKYGKYTGISALVMGAFICTGKFLMPDQANLFTVIGVISMLAVAQFGVRLFTFAKIKDGSRETADRLNAIPADCSVVHSALMAVGKYTLYAEHILLYGDTAVFFMAEQKGSAELTAYLQGCTVLLQPVHMAETTAAKMTAEPPPDASVALCVKIKGILM